MRLRSVVINTVIGKRTILSCKENGARGFTLLELLIAMFIIIVLLSVAIPTYFRSVQQARESVLKENLWQMRKAIDQYVADKGRLPRGISELVDAQYLREVPVDPVSDKTQWNEVVGEDPNSVDGGTGLKDVRSLSEDMDSEGRPYKEY